jgi:hypothetical protein
VQGSLLKFPSNSNALFPCPILGKKQRLLFLELHQFLLVATSTFQGNLFSKNLGGPCYSNTLWGKVARSPWVEASSPEPPLPRACLPFPPDTCQVPWKGCRGAVECQGVFVVTYEQLAKWIKEIHTACSRAALLHCTELCWPSSFYDSRKSQYFLACQGWGNLNELLNQAVNLPITDFFFAFHIYNDEKQT